MKQKIQNKEYNGIVYMYKNIINDKIYIGQTIHEKRRKREHELSGILGNEYLFSRAIKKYGFQNFTYQVLFRIDGNGKDVQDRLNFFEKYYIKKFKSSNLDFGYNLVEGGNSSLGWVPSEETKAKIKRNHANVKKENHPMWGKHHSEETKRKISEANKKYIPTEETKRKISFANLGKTAKQILCVETEIIYDSVIYASQSTGIGYSNLKKCAQGHNKTAGGYHWKYICGKKY